MITHRRVVTKMLAGPTREQGDAYVGGLGDGQRAAFAAEMSAAGVDWQLHLHGGAGHSFTNPEIDAFGFPGFAYHAVADRRSWQALRALFDEAL